MAENTTTSPVDPIAGFWRDVWARAGVQGGMGGMPGMPGMDVAAAQAFMTPEGMKRMQSAFYDAMAAYAEQHMRTPQFLEQMKKSMDQALAFRQQMDGFLKQNMSQAFETATGGSNTEVLTAIRQSTSQLQAQIAKLEERISHLEGGAGSKPAASAPSKNNESSNKKSNKR